MKHKTAELEGALLDAAVAKAEGWPAHEVEAMILQGPDGPDEIRYLAAGTSWALAGEIIERERICLQWSFMKEPPVWQAWVDFTHGQEADSGAGHTPLIAAMRCYVSSKFGETVDL